MSPHTLDQLKQNNCKSKCRVLLKHFKALLFAIFCLFPKIPYVRISQQCALKPITTQSSKDLHQLGKVN